MKKPSKKASGFGWLPVVLLVVAGLAAYANSLSGPFIFDDSDSILNNTSIDNIADVSAVMHPPHETSVAGRPFVNFTFAANVAAGGRDVTGFHVFNVALHIATGLLLFGVARRSGAPIAGAVLAILWTVHPLNTEAVNYITQRTELLMAFCLMLALYASIRHWTAASVVACALGMASKESMVIAPILIMAYDRVFVYPTWRDACAKRAKFYGALAATWLVLVWLVAGGGRNESAGFSAFDADSWTYLLNQMPIIARYLRLAIWPVGLAIDYGVPKPLTIADVWPSALLVVALGAATIVALVRKPRLGFIGLWLFLTLAPASSLLPIPTEVGAERRMYLPLMALIALAVLSAGAIWKRVIRGSASDVRIGIAASAVAAISLMSLTVQRNDEYRSALTLTETTVARYPTAAGESMYGTELAAAGRLMEAEVHLRRATSGYAPAHFYLATVLAARGDVAAAISEFEAFITSQPPHLAQVKTARMLSADLLEKSGRVADAIAQYQSLLAMYPDDVNVLARLANTQVRQSQFGDAIGTYRRLLNVLPDDPAALNGLGVALVNAGRIEEAIAAFQRVVQLAPDRPGAQENLQRALAMRGK